MTRTRWQQIRAQVIADADGICAACGKPGADTVQRRRSALVAVHADCNTRYGHPTKRSRKW